MNTVDLRAPMLLLGWLLELHGEGSELLVPLMAPLWLGLVENDPYCARMTGGAIRRSSPRAGGSAPPPPEPLVIMGLLTEEDLKALASVGILSQACICGSR